MIGTQMITGLNHITLAVSDLSRSVSFYRDVLGCELMSLQPTGAYFSVGGFWLCLSLDSAAKSQVRADYTHIAFSVSAELFTDFEARLADRLVPIWKKIKAKVSPCTFSTRTVMSWKLTSAHWKLG